MEKEGYRPSEAEIHAINEEALSPESRDGSAARPEKAPALGIQGSREEILRGLNVPEMPSGRAPEPKSQKKGKLPSQLEVAMRNTDPASTSAEAFEAMAEEQEKQERANTQEAERKTQFIADTAKIFFDKRWSQEIPGETVDAMLKQNGIEPWSDRAAAFMAEWDRKQAESIYDEAVQRFDGGIEAAKAEIARLAGEQKSATTGSARTRVEAALKTQEAALRALESARYVFIRGENVAPAEVAPAEEEAVPPEIPPELTHEGSVVNFPESAVSGDAAPAVEAQAVAVSEPENEQHAEDLKLAKGMLLELPDGRRVRILKKRLWRDKYYVEELNPDGTPQFRVDMEGDYLRQGAEVDEDSEESGGSAAEAPAEEERLAA
ncbi:MAG: hypothetical protein HYS45_02025 [Parcubacteria group bacterium]|nr:hypothetical protein [Parcubacteria group bacterium]